MPILSCNVALNQAANQAETIGELNAVAQANTSLLREGKMPRRVSRELIKERGEVQAQIAGMRDGVARASSRALSVCGLTSIDPVTRAAMDLGAARGVQRALRSYGERLEKANEGTGRFISELAGTLDEAIIARRETRDAAIAKAEIQR